MINRWQRLFTTKRGRTVWAIQDGFRMLYRITDGEAPANGLGYVSLENILAATRDSLR